MNRPPPQLANSKQIKLSLVPARLFQGNTLGDWGHSGRASRDLGLPTQRRKPSGLQGLRGTAGKVGTAPGRGRCSHHHFPHLSLAAEKLGQCHCVVWSVDRDPSPISSRDRCNPVPHQCSPDFWLPSGEARPPAPPWWEVMRWGGSLALACPGAGQEEDRGGSSLVFLSFTSPRFHGLAETFTFEPLFPAEKIQLG